MSGFNLKMNSINAALGLAQIKRINSISKNKIKIKKIYKENLKKFNYLIQSILGVTIYHG